MSDYTLENRQDVVNVLTERVISNAPVRELLRVYSEAVQSAIANLSDADVVRSIAAANYGDILEAFSLEVPAAEEAAESTESTEG
jgi:predicted HTH transcriptional regulator